MSRSNASDVHARLDELERTNRNLRRLALALAAGGALLVGTSLLPRSSDVLEGTALRLVDAEGSVRLEARAGDADTSIELRGPDGGRRVVLTSGTEEGLWLFDGRGVERVALVAGEDQGLYLQDEAGHDRLGLVTTGEDEGLFFRNDRGVFVVDEAGAAAVRVSTGELTPR